MSIISITAGSYSNGRQIAKSVARRLEYEYVDIEIILPLVSSQFGVPESKLARALKEIPSSVGMFSQAKQQYMIYVDTVLSEYLLKNNIVYYGIAGFPVIREISHILKVQIIADLVDRINDKAKQSDVSPQKARKALAREDGRQRKWAETFYNMNISDPSLYDLVINIGHIKNDDIENALETIITAVNHTKFQPMTYSLRCANNIAMSCRVRAMLASIDAKMKVKSDEGTVCIYTKAVKKKAEDKVLKIKQKVMKIEGIKHVEVYVDYDLFSSVACGQ